MGYRWPTIPGLPPVVTAVCVLLLAGWPELAEGQDRDRKIEDLRERAVVIRSIDPADEDFSDLAPLAEAIGHARIVQLGESTHDSGASFAAKARLVKFLHQELGFDVLVWESGMYDVRVTNDSLRAGADPVASAALGVFGIWASSAEVAPVFHYARRSYTGDRPLEMAGVDTQFSRREVADLERDLLRFSAALETTPLGDRATVLIRELMEGFRTVGRGGDTAPTQSDLDHFLVPVDAILNVFVTERPELIQVHGEREVAFTERLVGNLRVEGIRKYTNNLAERPGAERAALVNRGWNERDARMADNLRWLAETWYPNGKLIVWAHNGHIMNAYYESDWSALSHDPTVDGMTPMGVYITEQMGDAVYTISFTAFGGETGFAGVPLPDSGSIEEPPAESLEALLHDLGYADAFLDFRALPADHWLRQPSTMAIRGYMPEAMDDWTSVVDGIVFTDRMTPVTPIE